MYPYNKNVIIKTINQINFISKRLAIFKIHKIVFFFICRLVPLKALLFYGSDLNITDLPTPRNQEIWALFHEESIKNAPVLLSEKFMSLFNFTSTFNRDSDLPLTTMHLNDLNEITDMKFFIPTTTKNEMLQSIAPVVYIQSSCDTLTDRDAYVANLNQLLKIDSYGKCLNNNQLPKNLDTLKALTSAEFLTFLSRYKFTIAIENAICDDYITEKLWRSLIVGSVPLYFGSPRIRDWLPNNSSAIFIDDYKSPRDLADFIIELNSRDELYNQFLLHKTESKINNDLLQTVMKNRSWSGYGSLIEKFECDVCLALHESERLKKTHQDGFKCKPPISMLTKNGNESNFWNAILKMDRCRGHAVYNLISRNESVTVETVEEQVKNLLTSGEC